MLHLITLNDTHAHILTLVMTPIDERTARRRDFYLTKQGSQQTDIHVPTEFEPAIPASEWPQAHFLNRAATGIYQYLLLKIWKIKNNSLSAVKKSSYTRMTYDD